MKIQNTSKIQFFFDNFVDMIKDDKLRETCNELKNFKDFWSHVGSIGHHHSYRHGLIIHTLEVVSNSLHIAKAFSPPDVNLDVLITAGLWHDLCKIWDYEQSPIGTWTKTKYHGNIHHIAGSAAEFTAAARKFSVPTSVIHQIQHAILAHHGTKEWNSVRIPDTLEAVILHQGDMLSAKHPHNLVTPI